MDCRTTVIFSLAVLLAVIVTSSEGRNKKVVIHVPYKVKKIRHTHTVYKTIHHHHMHHDHEHGMSPADEHEHFHHMHLHDEPPIGSHSEPVGIGIPEFLPDVPLEVPLDIPDLPHREIPGLPNRHIVPLYRRN